MKTSRRLRFAVSRPILAGILVAAAVAPWLLADVNVPVKTVAPGQNYQVIDPGQISTNNNAVEIQSGGSALFRGGTIVLKPGFHAATGSIFVATIDSDGDGFSDTSDSDGDGLPDWWETIHFGNPTAGVASVDSDGDGLSNLAEYLAGRSPNVNESSTTPPANSQVVVKVPSGKFHAVKNDWSITPVP